MFYDLFRGFGTYFQILWRFLRRLRSLSSQKTPWGQILGQSKKNLKTCLTSAQSRTVGPSPWTSEGGGCTVISGGKLGRWMAMVLTQFGRTLKGILGEFERSKEIQRVCCGISN